MELGLWKKCKPEELKTPAETGVTLLDLLDEIEALELYYGYNHSAVIMDMKQSLRQAVGKKVLVREAPDEPAKSS